MNKSDNMMNNKTVIIAALLCAAPCIALAQEAPKAVEFDLAKATAAFHSCDYALARDLSAKAAADGDAEAQNMLCAVYMGDNDVSPAEPAPGTTATIKEIAESKVAAKYAEALKWCRKSADQGNMRATVNLAGIYRRGLGVKKDYAKAMELYSKAATDDPLAEYLVGMMHYRGQGVKEDPAEALKWFGKAAGRGLPEAMLAMGVMYEFGKGVQADQASAAKWYRMAAAKNYAQAEFYLGDMYLRGRGVAKDEDQALSWYRKAADHGNAEAKRYLERKAKREMSHGMDALNDAVNFGNP